LSIVDCMIKVMHVDNVFEVFVHYSFGTYNNFMYLNKSKCSTHLYIF